MVIGSLEILHGCCAIPLYRKVSGNNWHPHTVIWEICDNTLVDESDFFWLNCHRWLMSWSPNTKSYCVYRNEKLPNGKIVHIYMAREILDLPPGSGKGGEEADHENHDTKNNRRCNLRVATPSQNGANRRKLGVQSRFKGVRVHGSGFMAQIRYDGQLVWFLKMRLETEAGLIYNYSANILFGEFAHLNIIPEDEMPTVERQWELWDLVVEKLKVKLGDGIVDGLLQSRGLAA